MAELFMVIPIRFLEEPAWCHLEYKTENTLLNANKVKL